MKRADFEIMAPVGSPAALSAAARAGADAVYFGIAGLNMRSRSAANFTLEDLPDMAERCRRLNLRSYLTVNTIIYDDDIAQMNRIIDAAADADISAVIATDISTILYCRRRGVPVHISTQANISNTEAVRYYAQWAETVVLSRELNLTQVEAIHRAIVSEPILGPGGKPVSIEMFCHGALCMAVSGKCYLSLHAMNSSANRGACTQICRRAYRLSDKDSDNEIEVDNEFLMSPKDLKTIHFLDRMVDAGVRVFKIEGRARGPEYVAATVSCYDEALRAICDGSFGEEKVRGWDERLARVFNRGFWNGYYLGQRLGEWSGKYGSSATRTKSYAARPLRYFPRLGVAEFLLEAGEIRVGDELLVTGPTTGALEFKAGELRLDSGVTDKVVKGDVFSVAVPAKIRLSDRLYLLR
ncbi:putative uncharacterized protein [Prevotella sp. CAG:485]|nr:putative uncharacterized protein [Prevotella sp. CAG:485]